MLQVALCDDEKNQLRQLRAMLESIPLTEPLQITEYNQGSKLLQDMRQGKHYDVLILDVEMPEENGISLAKQIREIDESLYLLFLSNHTSYVFSAFQVAAFRYLVKPISRETLMLEMNQVVEDYHKNHTLYTIQEKGRQLTIEVGNIRYLEVFGHTLSIHTTTENITCKKRLEDEVKKLTPYGFIQCHRSYLVNPKYISEIDRSVILTDRKEVIPISKKNLSDVMQQFQNFLAGRAI